MVAFLIRAPGQVDGGGKLGEGAGVEEVIPVADTPVLCSCGVAVTILVVCWHRTTHQAK